MADGRPRSVPEEVVRGCLAGDETAWRALIDFYRGDTRRHIRSILLGYGLGHMVSGHLDEIENYVYGELFKYLSRYRFYNFHVWFAMLRRSKTIQYLRKEFRHLNHVAPSGRAGRDEAPTPFEIGADRKAIENWRARSIGDGGPFDHALIEEVRSLAETLPPRYRVIYKLYFIEGLGCSQVASLLDLNENTVRTRLRRTILKMEKILNPGEGE